MVNALNVEYVKVYFIGGESVYREFSVKIKAIKNLLKSVTLFTKSRISI